MMDMNFRITIKSYLLSIVTILITTVTFSQSKDVGFYQQKYPNNIFVKLNHIVNVEIKLKNDEVVITETTNDEDLFLTDAANMYSKESVSYSNFYNLSDISASSYTLKGDNYEEHKIKDFSVKDELSVSFYDDIKSLNFVYPNLTKGSKSSLNTVFSVSNPRFVSSLYLGGAVPYINSKIKVTVDNNINVDFKEFHINTIDVNFKETKKKKKTVYQWEVKNIRGTELLRGSPSYKNYYPHIIPVVKNYKTKDKLVKVSQDVDALYKWYYSLVKDLDKKEYSKELVTTVNELIKDKKTELDKVKAIYYWAQKNIKYVAFEYDLGGFVPRKPNEIFSKKYGDCKDNSMLLYSMLDIANIKSCLTWIGTRKIPYKYDEVPTPAVDNHMILTYENGQNTYFLDATGRYNKLGTPTSFIQGKEALIGYSDSKYKVKKVPVIAAELNTVIDSVSLKIDNFDLKGTGIKAYKGYPKTDKYSWFERVSTDREKLNYYRSSLRKGNNKFKILSHKGHNELSYDKPYSIDYSFVIPNFISSYEDEVYVDLNLDKVLKNQLFDEKRVSDYEADYKYKTSFVFELTIPDDYELTYLPKNIDLDNKFFKSNITYSQKGNKVYYNHSFQTKYLVLKKENFSEIFNETKKIVKAYKELLVLKKKVNEN